MFKFIFKIIFILAVFSLVYFAYPIIKERYFETEKKDIISSQPTDQDKPPINANDISEKTTTEDLKKTDEQQTSLKEEGKIFQKITPANCDAECVGFEGDALDYCNEICGLIPPAENVSGCDALSRLKKDYCLKDSAISKKDFTICDQIIDKNVQQTCKNRMIEELMNDGQNNSNTP
jgi:hypothetical protein